MPPKIDVKPTQSEFTQDSSLDQQMQDLSSEKTLPEQMNVTVRDTPDPIASSELNA